MHIKPIPTGRFLAALASRRSIKIAGARYSFVVTHKKIVFTLTPLDSGMNHISRPKALSEPGDKMRLEVTDGKRNFGCVLLTLLEDGSILVEMDNDYKKVILHSINEL